MPAVQPHEEEQRSALAPGVRRTAPEEPGRPAVSSAGSIARKLGLAVILAAAAGFAYWKMQSNQKEAADTTAKTTAQANRAIPVTTATIATRPMPIYLTALGTVTAYNTVTIKSRVDGQLLTVAVREGQHVNPGQVLATIDPRPYEAAVAQAQGQLAKDQASADYAKAEAGRYTSLYEAGVVSKDSQQVQASSAGQSAGVLDADRAAIQAARVNVAYTRISSPISGVVGLRQVDAGNIVHASDATGLLVITQLQPIAVIFTLPEDQLPTVMQTMRTGRKLTVEAYDRSNATRLATGTLLTLDNEIDTTTGTVKAKAVFDNKDAALFPNQFVNIRLILEQRPDALVMPAAALQSGASGSFVFLLKPGNPPEQPGDHAAGAPSAGGRGAGKSGGKPTGSAAAGDPPADATPKAPYYVDVQNVTVDLTEGSQIILKSGLKAGDQVVIDGQEKLKKYSKVDPKAAAPRAGRGGNATAAGAPAPGQSGNVENPDQTLGPRVHGEARGNQAVDSTEKRDRTGAPGKPQPQPQAQP